MSSPSYLNYSQWPISCINCRHFRQCWCYNSYYVVALLATRCHNLDTFYQLTPTCFNWWHISHWTDWWNWPIQFFCLYGIRWSCSRPQTLYLTCVIFMSETLEWRDWGTFIKKEWVVEGRLKLKWFMICYRYTLHVWFLFMAKTINMKI